MNQPVLKRIEQFISEFEVKVLADEREAEAADGDVRAPSKKLTLASHATTKVITFMTVTL